jgi:hypothetical protein
MRRKPKRTTPRQWNKLISRRSGIDSAIVAEVTAEILAELYERIMLGESVLLPVGCIEPHEYTGKRHNVVTRQLEDARPRLVLRTSTRFRKKYHRAIANRQGNV